MKSENKLIYINLALSITIVVILVLLSFLNLIPLILLKSILAALAITSFNFVLTIISIRIALRKYSNSFFNIYLGGMGIRLFLSLLLIIISISFLDISKISFIFSILIFYGFFLISEIIYLNIITFYKVKIKGQNPISLLCAIAGAASSMGAGSGALNSAVSSCK